MFLLFAAAVALAQAPPAHAPPDDAIVADWDAALQAVRDLRDAGQTDAARATVDLLLRQDLAPADRQRALDLQAALPVTRDQSSAIVLLAAGQTAIFGYLLGPHLASLTYDPNRSATPYYLGALGGAAVGAGSAVVYGLRPGFDAAQAQTVLSAEVLGGASGAVLGLVLDPYDRLGAPWGTLGGVVAGAAGGHLLATLEPSARDVLAGQSGAVWGAGLALTGVLYLERFDEPEQVAVPLVVGADAGAALGVLVARRLDLSQGQIAWADLGLTLGSGTGLLVMGIIASNQDVSWQQGTALVAAGGLTGGLLGGFLADPDRRGPRAPFASAALSGRPGDLRLAVPVPRLSPGDEGLDLKIKLASCRF